MSTIPRAYTNRGGGGENVTNGVAREAAIGGKPAPDVSKDNPEAAIRRFPCPTPRFCGFWLFRGNIDLWHRKRRSSTRPAAVRQTVLARPHQSRRWIMSVPAVAVRIVPDGSLRRPAAIVLTWR